MYKYKDLIDQTFQFPTPEFCVKDDSLFFHNVDLMQLVKKYGTPIKLSYLPKIGHNISEARRIFGNSISKYGYSETYQYVYCTKSSHFQFVLNEVVNHKAHLETSSAFDMPIIRAVSAKANYNKVDHLILCNGFKTEPYLEEIRSLIEDGFSCIPILDNLDEFKKYDKLEKKDFSYGVRLASDEEPNFSFYTSRLGIRYRDAIPFYQDVLAKAPAKLKILHFFINTGIQDSSYYWTELRRFIRKYCELKEHCFELDSIDIGGGFPIKKSLQFDYDYQYMSDQIVKTIQEICLEQRTPLPKIFTEFGSYTVGETGATLYSVLNTKFQNDKEKWYMMDGSFITQTPDVWGENEKYILLPLNHWDKSYQKVNLGGLTCDRMDYYDSEAHIGEVFLPAIDKHENLYFGLFHTGAYQESLGGYGGIQHCLIPAPKHVVIEQDTEENHKDWLFAEEQNSQSMLKILGY
ncbi:MAG: arginine decarboxylase [Bacteroidota bacterium]